MNKTLFKRIKHDWQLYLLLLFPLLFYAIFMYGPMYGIQLAFKNFKPLIGISGSPWVGFVHFKNFFNSFYFSRIIKNTLGLNLYFMIIGFPVPIILALLLNEVRIKSFKKIVQTITYFPHFISVVVLASMITTFVNSEYGIINQISSVFGVPPVNYLQEEQWFKTIHVFSTIWQSSGWNAIVYISVLSTVDSQLLEAASIDGASRLQRVWYINVPAVIPTAILMFILNTGRMMTVGFEKVFLLQNPLNMNTSDVISTYVYRIGIQGGQYGTATAVGLFNSVINLILILLVNKIASTLSESSLW